MPLAVVAEPLFLCRISFILVEIPYIIRVDELIITYLPGSHLIGSPPNRILPNGSLKDIR